MRNLDHGTAPGRGSSLHVLGVNCFSHDTSAALVTDGRLVAFVEEERLNRDKHTKAFPELAIEWCLKHAGLRMSEVDAVTVPYRPGLDFARALAFDVIPRFPMSVKRLAVQTIVDVRLARKAREFKKRFGYTGPVIYTDHHRAHAASGFFASPFERAVAVSIDRGGDYVSTAAFACEGTEIRPLFIVRNPHSIGELYSAVTWWLGFLPNSDEGKTMGLAPYGRDTHVDAFRRMVRLRDDGRFRVDLGWAGWHLERGWLSKRFLRTFGPPRGADEPLTPHHEDVAYALQAVTEETGLHVVRAAAERAGIPADALCLAGGVALNSVMNARLLNETSFGDVFIQPAAGDAGNALGAALLAWHELAGKPRDWRMEHAYWGPEYRDDELRRALGQASVRYVRVDDPAERAAELLADGKIIGWFQGRAEVGPRALGNRSILADPRPEHMKDTINRRVKHREPFRPFAPSVLAEAADEWFDGAHPSPFMLLVLPVQSHRRDRVPAITHVDGTGRLQTVTSHANPEYYRLIEAFGRRTGVPMVLNTSFNDKGEPIVCSPEDALKTFATTDLDALMLGPYLVEKPPS